MNTQLLIKALCYYRKKQNDSLKSNLKHGRTDIADSNVSKISEIEIMIDELKSQLINERLNILA